MRVLVLNAGSSTLKWTLREVSGFDAVGHRVVHGGTRFRDAPESPVAVLLVHAREDLMVFEEVLRLSGVTSVPQ